MLTSILNFQKCQTPENLKKAGIVKRFENIELDKCLNEILNEIENNKK